MEISRFVSQGLLRQDDVDDRVREFLAAQEPWVITQALSDFSSKDMSRIMNKSNFLKGIVRKLLEGEDRGGGGVVNAYQAQLQQQPPSNYVQPPSQIRHFEPYQSRGGGKGGGKGRGKGGWGY
jgi:hypothetical protein